MNKTINDNSIIISVIIPCYNRSSLIEKTLDSFFFQSSKDFELIVINDGSTDDTDEILKKYKKFPIRYYKIINSERGYARNFGFLKSRGNFINFFDSDDLALPNHIESAINYIKNNDTNVFHFSYLIKNIKKNKIKKKILTGLLNKYVYEKNILCINSLFIKKNILINNKFSTNVNLSGSEDWELWIRIAKQYRIEGIKNITNQIIQHDNRSMSQTNFKNMKLRVDTFIGLIKEYKNNIKLNLDENNLIHAELNSILALYSALSSNSKFFTMRLFFKSIKYNYKVIFRLRTLIIFKLMLYI